MDEWKVKLLSCWYKIQTSVREAVLPSVPPWWLFPLLKIMKCGHMQFRPSLTVTSVNFSQMPSVFLLCIRLQKQFLSRQLRKHHVVFLGKALKEPQTDSLYHSLIVLAPLSADHWHNIPFCAALLCAGSLQVLLTSWPLASWQAAAIIKQGQQDYGHCY